ncbi:MAG: GNAT family N-acetyltransferase [Gammaproteobacteria bacterium]|nr:GNAT family N-acetyltransferase [Gammaproteobacteria bacterium]MBU2225103.1 GNAT family N-acetyltransferase [Gammaproteobacteria bacterium]
MQSPHITSNNLLIRAFTKNDLAVFASYRAEEAVARYQSWEHYTYQDAVALFEAMDYATFGTVGNWYQLAICRLETAELVGDLAIHFIDSQQVEIGFTIAPAYQQQMIATEAVTALLGYLFTELAIHRVVATTDVNNVASYRLLEKLGFRREGHFIQNIFFKGAWGDEYQYALLGSEYFCSEHICSEHICSELKPLEPEL